MFLYSKKNNKFFEFNNRNKQKPGVKLGFLANSTYNPVYCKIYLIKFYPRSLLKKSLIFYAININRYEMQYEEDILKMIIFIVFYMQSEEIIKLKELLRILPKKNYINMYESFIKFSVLTRYHKSNN